MEALMTVPAAARRVGISRQAMAKAAREGRLVAVKVGFDYVVTEADLKRFIQKRTGNRAA